MTWLALIQRELGPIPMFMWQYAAVLGVLAVTLVLTRPLRITTAQSNTLYAVVLAATGYMVSALFHLYLPPPSSAPIRYDLLFLAGLFGGWRGGVLGYVLIYGARLQWAGSIQWAYTGIDMAIVTLGGVWAHRFYAGISLADLSLRRMLLLWGLRSLTLIVSGLLLVGLHLLPKEWIRFDLLPYPNSVGSLVRKTLMAGPALLFFAAVFAMFRLDALDRRRQEQEWRSSRHDSLTLLPNRRALGEHLERLLQAKPAVDITLIGLGTSNHSQLLLRQGHGWGDAFLKQLAHSVNDPATLALLQAPQAAVYQFTDTNLVLVWTGHSAQDIQHLGLAERLHQALSLKLRETHRAGAVPMLTLAVMSCRASQYQDAATVLRDLGLHLLDQAHEIRPVSFLQDDYVQNARREEWLAAQLNTWIDAGNPPLAYMPKCRLDTGELIGAEALLRCTDAQGQPVPPGQVLSLATRHRLLAAFEWSTLEQACRDARAWKDMGQGPVPTLSVNVSSGSLVTPGFGRRLLTLLTHRGLSTRALMLELTEYDALPDIDSVRDNVRLLTDHGIRLSLDDFGNGHSGLTLLARLPFAELKVDPAMVALIDKPRMRAALQLALESARRYDAEMVAEGVETETQRQLLQQMGIRNGQGHHFAQALTLHELAQHQKRDQQRHQQRDQDAAQSTPTARAASPALPGENSAPSPPVLPATSLPPAGLATA